MKSNQQGLHPFFLAGGMWPMINLGSEVSMSGKLEIWATNGGIIGWMLGRCLYLYGS
jgi:hypothetical protein